jgi:hypothetical protein
MKLGAFAWNAGWVENVPGPVQTLKFASIFRSVISIDFERSGPSITTLVVVPFTKSLEGARHASAIRAAASVFLISYLQKTTSSSTDIDVASLLCVNAMWSVVAFNQTWRLVPKLPVRQIRS